MMRGEHGDRVSFRTFSVLPSIILLSFGVCAEVQSKLTGSLQPIIALVGDDVTLPCGLQPPSNASSETVEWTREDLPPQSVHFHKNGKAELEHQNSSYEGRTALFEDELKNGNVSLKLLSVKISDAGKYFCKLGSVQENVSIQLTVGAVSTPTMEVVSHKNLMSFIWLWIIIAAAFVAGITLTLKLCMSPLSTSDSYWSGCL